MIRRLLGPLLVLVLAGPAWSQTARYDVSLTIDPVARTLNGRASLSSSGEIEALGLSSDLQVKSLTSDGRDVAYRHDGGVLRLTRPIAPGMPLAVSYGGTLLSPGDRSGPFLRRIRLDADGGVLPELAGWYPMAGGIETFHLDLTVLGGQVGIAPGRIVGESQDGDSYRVEFVVEHPIDGMPVFTGPYRIDTHDAAEVQVRTYFHPELADKSETYLTAVSRYLDLYSGQIGPYPYPAFHVVSSPLPVGLGYPYLTNIGRRVLQLPFIPYTSLPHEVLHSWWGNGVFVDYGTGNWAEGLTTYMADYALAGRRNPQAQRDMRARWLADYAALPASRETSLAGFRARTHGAAQVVGYHKAAMLFHMLERRIGPDVFADGLRRFWRQQRFKTAGWQDLRTAFETVSGHDLSGFFAQWLERTGAPELTLAESTVTREASGYDIRFQVGQTGEPYDLQVPVRLRTEAGEETHTVTLGTIVGTAALQSASRPVSLSLDPDFDLFRRLPPGDAPALLRQVMLAEAVALEIEPGDVAFAEAARKLAERLAEGRVEGTDGPRLLIGRPDWIAGRAQGPLAPPADAFDQADGTASVWARRDGDGRLAVMIAARDAKAVAALMRPLPHYGSKSYLVFDGRRAVANGIWNEPPRSTTVRFE